MTDKLEPFCAQITVDTSKAFNDLSIYIPDVEDFCNDLITRLDFYSIETQRLILTALCAIQRANTAMEQENNK